MASVTLSNLTKTYRNRQETAVAAVDGIDLEIRDREFMVLVGPSGCGKTTTLRLIAGLEQPDSGEVRFGQKRMNAIPAAYRGIAMVFQNYALYPHLRTFQNMSFGLSLQKIPRAEAERRVHDAASILGIQKLLHRRPHELSGGQRQRVALGRALVRQPRVFLFDEPLSNLDAKLRATMRAEISKLHASLATTMIYVTHDQMEAMSMGDRITVMRDGKIMQTGEPREIYNHPTNRFVASFIGSPPMNFIPGIIQNHHGGLLFSEDNTRSTRFSVVLPPRLSRLAQPYLDKVLILGIRPEDIQDATSNSSRDPDRPVIDAMLEVEEPTGPETFVYLSTGAHTFTGRFDGHTRYSVGRETRVRINLDHAHLFDPATDLNLAG